MASSASASAVVRNLQVVRTKVAQAVATSMYKQQVRFTLFCCLKVSLGFVAPLRAVSMSSLVFFQ